MSGPFPVGHQPRALDLDLLRRGLAWTCDDPGPQPEGGVMSHHGMLTELSDKLHVSVTPDGYEHLVVVSCSTGRWSEKQRAYVMPTKKQETFVAGAVEPYGIARTWLHKDGRSWALKKLAHPDVKRLVDNYHKGCPDHPHESVFCKCGWYDRHPVVFPEGWR